MQPLAESELIINPDGSIYHLNLLPEDIATTIITVGDPERVDQVAKFLDSIELTKHRREFKTVTGLLGSKRITIISTGIGTDNIDIVFNELDALLNIDFKTRLVKDKIIQADIIRIGTSGIVTPDIPVDSLLISKYAIGLEGLLAHYNFQQDQNIYTIDEADFEMYMTTANQELVNHFNTDDFIEGITVTATGFYGPQNRSLRLSPKTDHTFGLLKSFQKDGLMVTNLEMETAGIYGIGYLLGHRCISFNALLANRALGTFSKQPSHTVEKLIQLVLEKVVSNIDVG